MLELNRGGDLGAAESHVPESQERRIRCQAPLAEQKRNDPPAQPQTSTAPQLHLAPEEAGDAGRAAQKEQLHAELKRVLQQKGRSQPGSEEAEKEGSLAVAGDPVETQLPTMEKKSGTSELLEVIVETEAEVGLSGMSVAGGGKEGIFVKDVLKGSPAARALSLREGDQLLSARVYFDNMKYEDALQILKSAEPYKISFCLKRTVPGTDMPRSPGAPAFEGTGPKAKMAKRNLQSLTSLKKKPKKAGKAFQEAEGRGSQEPLGGKLEGAPMDVEFSLPRFSKLRKAKSAGEVAEAQPSPDLSPLLSSLETKRRKLKLPRLKVKEALAARAGVVEGWVDAAFPKASGEQKAGAKGGGAEAKMSAFPVLFSKDKKAKGEGAAREEGGFQAPQVELDFPLPMGGLGGPSPKASTKHEGFAAQILPQVEVALPKGSPMGVKAPEEGSSSAGLKLLVTEVAAPKVDVGLSLPRLEGTTQEAVPNGEGFQLRVPKVGISAEGAKPASPDKADGPEEKVTMGVKVPALEMGLPSVDLALPLPKEKAEVEIPEVSRKGPTVNLPKLGSRHQEEESRVPQVELCVGKPESPKTRPRSSPHSRVRGLGVSLMERKPESKEATAVPVDSKVKSPSLKVPSLDISAPKVADMKLPKAFAGLTAPAPAGKAEAEAERTKFKLQMPEVSLPKCSIPDKAMPSPPQISAQVPKADGARGETAGLPTLGLSFPAVKPLQVQLPKGHGPKPELGLPVDGPPVEGGLSTASSAAATAAALELGLPKVELELDLPTLDRERTATDLPPRDHEAKLRMPTLESLSKDVEVEISVPKCRDGQPELEPGLEVVEGTAVGAIMAKIPKVDLALGKEQVGDIALVQTGGMELEGSAKEGQMKLPSVEISAVKFSEVTTERGKSLEPEAKLKSPKFALPKFSISGPKVWKVWDESFAAQAEGPGAADQGPRLKMPKFGISFPKSRWGVGVEAPKPALGGDGRTPKERVPALAPEEEPSEDRVKIPSVALPQLAVDIGLPRERAESCDEEGARTLPELGIEFPDSKHKVPKFSLVKSGGKGQEGNKEFEMGGAKKGGSREAPEEEEEEAAAKAKGSKFKMSLFSMARRDFEGRGPAAESKARKGPGSPKEKPRAPLVKMPKAERSQLHVPQVELPKISPPEASVEEAPLVGSGSPSLKAQVPLLEIAVPAKVELTLGGLRADTALGASVRSYEAEARMPKAPSLGFSTPKVGLDLSLPSVGGQAPMSLGEPGAVATITLPQVELPTFRRGEEEAGMQLIERGGEQDVAGATTLGSKIRMPKVDIALPKAQLPDMELPTHVEEDVSPPTAEGWIKMPSVGLPKFSPPKLRPPEPPELEVSLEGGKALPTTKLSSPALRLPRGKGLRLDGEAETEMDLPKLELKVPKFRGTTEMLATETVDKVPSVGLCKATEEAVPGGHTVAYGTDSKLKLKIPSVSLSKAGTEPRADTQRLCPPPKEGEASFKMPQIALPDVGFSVDPDGTREAKAGAGKRASAEGLEMVEGFEASLAMPKIRIPALGVSVPKEGPQGSAGGDLAGKRATFRVPGVELSAPTLNAQAERDPEGTQLWHHGCQESDEGARRVHVGSEVQKSPGGKEEEVEAGKKYKVKMPKFGLSLSKAAGGAPGQEDEAKAKRSLFVLGRPREKGPGGGSGLLEGDEEAGSRGVMGKFKLRPTLGLSLSKLKMGSEVNGEPENSAATEKESSRIKLPTLGFAKAEGARLNGERTEPSLQNGTPDGKGKVAKLRLPQVELSSPSTAAAAAVAAAGAEHDPELSLQLVTADEAQEGPAGAFAGLKFKSPKIALSSFQKRNREDASAGVVVASAARTEMASLKGANAALKGEKSPKFKLPKLALSPKSHNLLEITSEGQSKPEEVERSSEEGLKVQIPQVGFSEEAGGP